MQMIMTVIKIIATYHYIVTIVQYMKRRTAIKSLSAIVAGIALFPGCSDGLTIEFDPTKNFEFDNNQGVWLEAISEAILPKNGQTLTTLEKLPDFVSKMIAFSQPDEDQLAFYSGYNLCTEEIKTLHEISASELTAEQIISYFSVQLENEIPEIDETHDEITVQQIEDKKFFCLSLRGLIIDHLRTSKEYQEDVLEYKLAPGSDSYMACVEV